MPKSRRGPCARESLSQLATGIAGAPLDSARHSARRLRASPIAHWNKPPKSGPTKHGLRETELTSVRRDAINSWALFWGLAGVCIVSLVRLSQRRQIGRAHV